jgi:hypothetical protein
MGRGRGTQRNRAVKPSRRWRAGAAMLAAAVAAGSILAVPPAARGQGLFNFFFGGFHRPAPPPQAQSYADPYGSPERGSSLAPIRPRHGSSSGGRGIAYCVRLCDGQHFPIQRTANATPVELCSAMCPASKTKVFFGNPIDHAAAHDGTRYANLDNAFVYRERLVPDCTCNGKDAFGLAPIGIDKDPTLRPGDLVATKDGGLLAYSGKTGRGTQTAEFTPVDPAASAGEAARKAAKSRYSRRGAHAELSGRSAYELRGQLAR